MPLTRSRLTAAAAVPVLAGALVVAGASTASAHTPDKEVSCSGVTGFGTSYEKNDTVAVYIDGKKISTDKAGADGRLYATAAVPQDFDTHTWRIVFDSKSNAYDRDWSGSVGPCAEKPPAPEPKVENRDNTLPPNCENLTVTTEHQTRKQADPTWNGREWVPGEWGPWTTTSTDTRPATVEECANPQLPEPEVETRPVTEEPICYPDGGGTIHGYTEQRSREAYYEGRELKWGDWTQWTKVEGSDTTTEASSELCPPTELPDAQRETRPHVDEPICTPDGGTVTAWTEERSRTARWENHEVVWGPWSEWTEVKDSRTTRDATAEECTPWTHIKPIEPEWYDGFCYADGDESAHIPPAVFVKQQDGLVALVDGVAIPDSDYESYEDGAYAYRELTPGGHNVTFALAEGTEETVLDEPSSFDFTVKDAPCKPTPSETPTPPTSTPPPTTPGAPGTPPAAYTPPANPPSLAQTGADDTGILLTAATALLLLGTALVVATTRRTRGAHA